MHLLIKGIEIYASREIILAQISVARLELEGTYLSMAYKFKLQRKPKLSEQM
jgi:hypothetical protein